jgi:hypothetical protein
MSLPPQHLEQLAEPQFLFAFRKALQGLDHGPIGTAWR